MRYIKQRHANGCGAASLAMVTGVSYKRAVQIIAPQRKKGEVFKGTLLEEVLKAFTDMGVPYKVRFDRKLRNVKNDAWISISLPCGCRHAIAWDAKNGQIMDPDPFDTDHDGNKLNINKNYVEKNLNFIIETIPS